MEISPDLALDDAQDILQPHILELTRSLGQSMTHPEHSRKWTGQLPLDGMPQAARLDFGYRLDVTGSRIRDAFVTLPYQSTNLWVWQVWGEMVDIFTIPMPLYRDKHERRFAFDDYSQAI